MNRLALLLAGSLALAGPARLAALTAYLPAPQTLVLQPTYSHQWSNDFWFADNRAGLPWPLVQDTVGIDGEWGLAPRLAVDWSLAYSTVLYKGRAPLAGILLIKDGQTRRSGLADTKLGIAYQLTDEFASPSDYTPTTAIRLGGIIAGDYHTGFANAIGDGAHGLELNLLFGKSAPLWQAGLYGELGYRWLGGETPDAWLGALGVYKSTGAFTFSTGLRAYHSVDGLDILGPGFTVERFPAVREIYRALELGVTWRIRADTTVSVGYARSFDGENTPRKRVIVVSGGFAF